MNSEQESPTQATSGESEDEKRSRLLLFGETLNEAMKAGVGNKGKPWGRSELGGALRPKRDKSAFGHWINGSREISEPNGYELFRAMCEHPMSEFEFEKFSLMAEGYFTAFPSRRREAIESLLRNCTVRRGENVSAATTKLSRLGRLLRYKVTSLVVVCIASIALFITASTILYTALQNNTPTVERSNADSSIIFWPDAVESLVREKLTVIECVRTMKFISNVSIIDEAKYRARYSSLRSNMNGFISSLQIVALTDITSDDMKPLFQKIIDITANRSLFCDDIKLEINSSRDINLVADFDNQTRSAKELRNAISIILNANYDLDTVRKLNVRSSLEEAKWLPYDAIAAHQR